MKIHEIVITTINSISNLKFQPDSKIKLKKVMDVQLVKYPNAQIGHHGSLCKVTLPLICPLLSRKAPGFGSFKSILGMELNRVYTQIRNIVHNYYRSRLLQFTSTIVHIHYSSHPLQFTPTIYVVYIYYSSHPLYIQFTSTIAHTHYTYSLHPLQLTSTINS